jgi:hypothetical protein
VRGTSIASGPDVADQGEVRRDPDRGEGPREKDISQGRTGAAVLLLVLGGVLAHRLYLVLSTDFPINDGGFFVAYIEATEQTFPGLPSTISYNGLDLPYAYPPAGFWLGALLAKFGVGAVGVLHVLPGLMNAAWLGLLALLFLREGQSRMFAAGAVAVVAVAFRSYEWLVMGGGLTRGLGAVFFVLGLVALGRTRGREPSPLSMRTAVLAGLCVAGAVLSHLEWGILAAASVVVQRAVCSASLKNFLVTTAVAGGTAAVCVAPWVLVVLSRHGLEPFLAASASSTWDLQATIDRIEGFTRFQWPNLLLAVGGIVLLFRRHLFWPTFILLCLVLTPRHSFTPLVLPVGYLTVSGLEAVVRVVRRTGSPWRELPEAGAVAALALVVVVPSVQAVERTRMVNPSFSPLSQDVRAAMNWVRDEHATSSFAVVTDPHWSYDASAEWFPELSGATSSTTVQGTEWLPGDAFLRTEREVMSMKVSPTCEEFVQRILALAPVDYVWTQTRLECFQAPAFSRVFSNPDVAIFAVS